MASKTLRAHKKKMAIHFARFAAKSVPFFQVPLTRDTFGKVEKFSRAGSHQNKKGREGIVRCAASCKLKETKRKIALKKKRGWLEQKQFGKMVGAFLLALLDAVGGRSRHLCCSLVFTVHRLLCWTSGWRPSCCCCCCCCCCSLGGLG